MQSSLGQGDLTAGPIFRTLVLFGSPVLLANVLQSLSGTINAFWVGRLIGDEALAATVNANIVIFLIAGAAFGFGTAGAIKVGRSFGAKDLQASRRAFGTTLSFGELLMVGIAILGYLLASSILTLLSTPGGAYALALSYLEVTFLATPVLAAFITIAACLRAVGDSRTPLTFTAVVVALDFVLNPLLIKGGGIIPPLGIAGSALSTLIANFLGLVGLILFIYKKNSPLRLLRSELLYLRPAREELSFIARKGVPIGAQTVIMSSSGMIMVALVNREGLLATAAYGAATQLWIYAQMPALAIGSAVSAMAAQLIGACKWDRLELLTKSGVLATFSAVGALTAVLILFDRQALGFFLGPESSAIPIAENIQLLASGSFLFYGINMVYSAVMRAAGIVWIPLLISILALFPARLGFYFFSYDWLGADAIWLSFPAGALAGLGFTYVFYRYSVWRQRAMAEVESLTARTA